MALHRISFEAASINELVRQCKAYVAAHTPRPIGLVSAAARSAWLVPSWAPKGSRWLAKTDPPTLIGPDAQEIEVRWVAGTPQRPL